MGCKWIFKLKKNANGSIQCHKARLVAKGFHQSPCNDFFETFSTVAKAPTIQIVLFLVVSNCWQLHQVDFNNAFLNGSLSEVVYMWQPPDYEDPLHCDYVCKLNKAICGLKQATHAWNDELRRSLRSFGFQDSKLDSSLFYFSQWLFHHSFVGLC